MGIDAEMLVRVPRKMTPGEVKRVAVRMQSAFPRDTILDVVRPGLWSWEMAGRHSLQIVKVYEQDGPDIKPKKGETLIRVHLSSRFYGPGYERGNIVGILAVARYLRTAFAPCSVWYGGDSSGVCAQPLEGGYEDELWAHFCGDHSRDYFTDSNWTGAAGRVHCDFCDLPACSNMAGGNKTGHYCISCGAHWLLYANGQLVEADEDYKPLAARTAQQ